MFDPAKRKRNKQALDFEFKTHHSMDKCVARLKAAHRSHSDYSSTFVQVEPIEETRWQFSITRMYQRIPPYPRKGAVTFGLLTIDVYVTGKLIEHDTEQTSVYASARMAQATVIGQRIKIGVVGTAVSIVIIGGIALNLSYIVLCAAALFLVGMMFNQRLTVHNDHYINQTVSYIKQLLV